jgi:predicted nuclease of restriction endonuclease-like (RecB) superfamily
MEQQILIHNNADYISAVKIIKDAILKSRYRAAQKVNNEMLALYYGIGGFISVESRNAQWGTGAINAISLMLKQELPGLRGFSETNIKRMRQFYEAWSPYFTNRPFQMGDLELTVSDKAIIIRPFETGDLSEQDLKAFLSVGFTLHGILLSKTETLDERLFYIRMCAEKFWDADELRYHIEEGLYKDNWIQQTNFGTTIADYSYRQKALQSFKNEYLVDFVNIEDEDAFDERVLENEIVRNIKNFIMAMGTDFTYMGNQYHLKVGEEDYYVDLLFYHRRLRCLVAVELKRGKFRAEYVGKLNLYLSALDEYVKLPDENPSIGIILCRSKDDKVVEFSFRDTFKAMGVATYKTRKEIEAKQEIENQFLRMGEELKKLL